MDSSSMEHKQHYGRFALMIGISFILMYGFMYAMVNAFANVYPNTTNSIWQDS